MLFASWPFLFLFLPALILAWRAAAPLGPASLGTLLLAASLLFYGLWGVEFLILLLALTGMNHVFGTALAAPGDRVGPLSRKGALILALVLNLAPLVWFKYAAFLAEVIAQLTGTEIGVGRQELPLGISFYTFLQIAWLVGVHRRAIVPAGLKRHAMFVTAFPWVISGPIVRYEQMGPQLDALAAPSADGLAHGFALFALGMAKKVLLADTLAPYANAVFNAAERAFPLSGWEAWLGSLCYSFQLYFDFSGYTDMAIGLGLMIGLHLPENFDAPYKSTGIVEFWRRWHITLGSWLRDFLYIPMGGSRAGRLLQYRNLFLTMLIGGAWHGAGWTFIVWGALHGAMLTVNHWFRSAVRGGPAEMLMASPPMRVACAALTFLCVNWSWVIFRAQTLEGAGRVFRAMFGLPDATGATDGAPPALAEGLARMLPNGYLRGWEPLALLAVCAAVVWLAPTCRSLMERCRSGLKPAGIDFGLAGTRGMIWAVLLALLSGLSLLMLGRKAVFLYFQF